MLTIIGTGHAGYTLARELRKLDADRPMTLISADDGRSYYKPNLSKALAMGKSADDLVQAEAAAMAETLGATVRHATRVEAIDAAGRTIRCAGETLGYEQLVLATGALPIRLPIAGDAADDILSINALGDYARFREQLGDGSRVLLIGAGLIGCEFANDLAAQGHAVTAVDLAAWPLPSLLPEAAGRALQSALASIGVQWRLGQSVQSVNRCDNGYAVRLADGSGAEFDLLVSAVGLRPNTALAETTGLACQQGIVVDAGLRTSDANIWALGDCAELHGRVLPFILPIAHAARALARTLTGEATEAAFPAMPVMVKTPACPIIVCPPAPDTAGDWTVDGEAPDLAATFRSPAGDALGFALTGAATRRRGEFAKLVPPLYQPAG